MPAPWNSFSTCLLAKSDRIGGDRLDLLNRCHVIPPGREVDRQSGGFTPHVPLNRVPSGCSTGVESLGLFHWGALPSSGFRPRNSDMRYAHIPHPTSPIALTEPHTVVFRRQSGLDSSYFF